MRNRNKDIERRDQLWLHHDLPMWQNRTRPRGLR